MSEPKNVLVTGATGFLGSHLAVSLLQQGHHVTALARGSKTQSARQRVDEILALVAGVNGDGAAFPERLQVVDGDIAQPGLGLTESALKHLAETTAEVWHCAASLSFAEEDRNDIFRMNVGGTENILGLVARTESRRLHHVSTAYVAGTRQDPAMEDEIDVGQSFRNPYEESKCRAEGLVSAAHNSDRVHATVHRPSVVIGEAASGRSTHFHGVYAFIRGLWSALSRIRRRMGEDSVVQLPLRVLGSKKTTLNFVPIDFVVSAMLAIAARPDSLGRTFHLTNPEPTPNNVWLETICRVMRVEGVQLVGPEAFVAEPMTRLESVFEKQMAFYYMYLRGEPRFDSRNTADALRDTGIRCPAVDGALIDKMTSWYVNYLNHGGK